MVLHSTLRKMGDKHVFIVNMPAFRLTVPGSRVISRPAYKEAFATKAQADKYAAHHDPRQYGAAEFPVISRMAARAYLSEFWGAL